MLQFPNKRLDLPRLTATGNPGSLLRTKQNQALFGGGNDAAEKVLHALITKANREFASLLEDMSATSGKTLANNGTAQTVSQLLMRAVRCATSQYLLQAELGSLALTDELTGLFNRRGFMAIADRQLKVGRRSGRSTLLFFIDVDGLKKINDSFGHAAGDHTLKRAAQALQVTFRDSDVMARLGGDEFAVLAIEAAGHSEATIRTRLCEHLKAINVEEPRYAVTLSLGMARFDPQRNASIEELMIQADQAMYEERRRRSAARLPSLNTP